MAVYFLRSKHISRSNGSRVTRAAAYRAGERIRNEATSEVFDYCSRHDVSHKEVVLPAKLADRADMAWAQDRSTLWNAAEHAGRRCNSRLAREWLVFLPPELDPDQRRQLAQGFAHELADRYRAAVDVCVHYPSAQRWKKFREAQQRIESTAKRSQHPLQRESSDSHHPDRVRSRRRDHDLERGRGRP